MLPRSYLHLYKQIEYSEDNEKIKEDIDESGISYSPSLSNYLYNIKEKITSIEKQWDTFKKYTNPYEYIHTVVPLKKKSVSKHKPISRSYFKMIEIVQTFRLFFREPIRTFHLAEGPGGFIEAMVHMRKCPEDKYIGMTLLDEKKNDPNIPGWKKSENFMKSNTNIFLENGIDGTGDILSFDNFEYVVSKYGSDKMDIVTADGGFDFSIDFNQQEKMIGKLLFAQMAFAVCLNKFRGHFILKIFDCFMEHTVDILYILSSFYEKVYIMKPHTSRYANSERYVVCIGFLHDNITGFYPYLSEAFKSMMENPEGFAGRFINKDSGINNYFVKKIEEYNAIFGQKQIQNITYTISLIDSKMKMDKIESLLQTNIQKCMDWCNRFQVPFYSFNTPTNIFLGGTDD
jgi:23S rRNA U2552 (ribose-2'-O)-methylase RlmE/FtsJ